MLKWMKDYYVGEGIENSQEIQKRVNKKNGPSDIYLLTLAANPENVMEMLQASSLRNKIMYKACPMIIGMALEKSGAMNLATEILMECKEKTGTFRVEEYLKNR